MEDDGGHWFLNPPPKEYDSDSEDVVTVDHQDVGQWPQNAWNEWPAWRFFRNRSRLQHLLGVGAGVLVAMLAYLAVIAIAGEWHDAVVLRRGSTQPLRFRATVVAVLVTQLYFAGITTRGYGQWFLNFIIFPITTLILGIHLVDVLFTSPDVLTPEIGFQGDIGSISSPAYMIDVIKIGTPLLLVVWAIELILRRWVAQNPERAREWERKYMHVALVSYLVEHDDLGILSRK